MFCHLFETKIAYLGLCVFFTPWLSGIFCSDCISNFLLLFENQLCFMQPNPLPQQPPDPCSSPDMNHGPCLELRPDGHERGEATWFIAYYLCVSPSAFGHFGVSILRQPRKVLLFHFMKRKHWTQQKDPITHHSITSCKGQN